MRSLSGTRWAALAVLLSGLAGAGWKGQQARAQAAQTQAQVPGSLQLLNTMLEHENEATAARGRYLYLNEERSDRTGGHLWREWVAETDWGKVRYLTAVDGKPLTSDQEDAERHRLAADAANPEDFKKREDARTDGEAHARQMLNLLPRAFLLDAPRQEADGLRVTYHPNPAYQPASMEEKVLHAMSGSVLVDPKLLRMKAVDGHTSEDVSLSFGFATIKAGSNFTSVRAHMDGPDWKLISLHSDIRGRAMFLKLARQQDAKHADFRKIAPGMTVAAAVDLLEKQS